MEDNKEVKHAAKSNNGDKEMEFRSGEGGGEERRYHPRHLVRGSTSYRRNLGFCMEKNNKG
jgi:hypothetical protein